MKNRVVFFNCSFFVLAVVGLQAKVATVQKTENFSFHLPALKNKKNFVKKNTKPSFLTMRTSQKSERNTLKKELNLLTRHKNISDLSFKELRKAANLSLQIGWKEKALSYIRKMIVLATDSAMIEKLKLEIADVLFERGKLAAAEEAFSEYLNLYPGSPHSEYAHYKKILCALYRTHDIDQDQGQTQSTKKLCHAYLKKGIAFKKYRKEVNDIMHHCDIMLYQHEVNVFEFYLHKKSFTAATNRLAYLKEKHLPLLRVVEPDIIKLECKLAEAQGNTKRYNERLAYLNKKFPQHGTTVRVAQRTKKNYGSRF